MIVMAMAMAMAMVIARSKPGHTYFDGSLAERDFVVLKFGCDPRDDTVSCSIVGNFLADLVHNHPDFLKLVLALRSVLKHNFSPLALGPPF